MWLSFSMIMLDRSYRCESIPPTSMPYFSTSRKPGVVLRVPAMMPLYPFARARSLMRFDLARRTLSTRGRGRAQADALGRDAAAPREHVQRDALAEEEVPRLAAHRRDVLHGLERRALLHMPLHAARARQSPPAHAPRERALTCSRAARRPR